MTVHIIFSLITLWIIIGGTITTVQNIKSHRAEREVWQKERAEEYASWLKERQQLLDRIQASSFAEYKTQEVRVIRAQTGEKEPPKLEIM